MSALETNPEGSERRARRIIEALTARPSVVGAISPLPLVPPECWRQPPLCHLAADFGLHPLHPHLVLLLPEGRIGARMTGLPSHPGILPEPVAHMVRARLAAARARHETRTRPEGARSVLSSERVMAASAERARADAAFVETLMEAAAWAAVTLLGRDGLLTHERLFGAPLKRAMNLVGGFPGLPLDEAAPRGLLHAA